MSITTFDQIISARTGGNFWDWLYDGNTVQQTPIAGAWYNLTARIAQIGRNVLTYGTYVNSGNNGAIMNAVSGGAIPIPYSGSAQRFLTAFGAMVSSISGLTALMLIDILWAGGPITMAAGTITPTSTSPTLTRYTGSVAAYTGNMLMVDVGTLLGGTPCSIVVNYTKEDGSTTHSTTSFTPTVATGTANRVLQAGLTYGAPFIPLVSGDLGVSHINSITFASGSSPTGTVYLNIVRPLMVIPTLGANTWVERDITTTMDSLIELVKGSDSQHGCLAILGLGNGTTAANAFYQLRTVSG